MNSHGTEMRGVDGHRRCTNIKHQAMRSTFAARVIQRHRPWHGGRSGRRNRADRDEFEPVGRLLTGCLKTPRCQGGAGEKGGIFGVVLSRHGEKERIERSEVARGRRKHGRRLPRPVLRLSGVRVLSRGADDRHLIFAICDARCDARYEVVGVKGSAVAIR